MIIFYIIGEALLTEANEEKKMENYLESRERTENIANTETIGQSTQTGLYT